MSHTAKIHYCDYHRAEALKIQEIMYNKTIVKCTGKVTGIPIPAGTDTGTEARLQVGYG